MAGGTCGVCSEAPSKYKCPSCRTPYCSVTCFKNHKEKSCQKTSPQEAIDKSSLHKVETGKLSLQEETGKSSLHKVETGKLSLQEETGKSSPQDKESGKSSQQGEEAVKSSLHAEVTPDTTLAKCPNLMCHTKALEVEDPSWLVDNNRLRSIAGVKEIRDAVRNPELQEMILKIDGSSEPEKELEKLMGSQDFRWFSDKILNIVSPQE